jgi:RND family efflux transporter MFP subunit
MALNRKSWSAVSIPLVVAAAAAGPWSAASGFQPAERPAARAGVTRGLDPSLIASFSTIKAVTRPSRDAVMGFTVPTKITDIVVRGGQEVAKGQVIVQGDEAEDRALLRLQKVRAETDLPVERARKQMELAETEYRIQQEVRAGGGSSDQQLERARLAFEVAKIDVSKAQMEQTQEVIQVDRLESRVQKFRIDAPFDGVVDNVMLDVGHSASENDKVVRVVNVDQLWIDAPAPTQDAVTLSLKVGDRAWVLFDMAGTPIVREGKVIEAAPTADAASRTRRVRVEVANPRGPERLLAGEPAYVRFTAPSEEVGRALEAAKVAKQ